MSDIKFLFRIFIGEVNANVDSHLVFRDPGPTRGHTFKLEKLPFKNDSTKNSFIYRIVDQWNSLPAAALEARSVYSFDRIAREFLVDMFR
jgi:hypothetical protein